ncbi:MAG: DUF6538 domain-containing protein [Sulfitobacter sp.]
MSVIVFEVGAYIVMSKYTFRKPGSDLWYFRRRIPDDLRKHYPSRKNGFIVCSLKTRDVAQAAKLAHQIALEQDALWQGLRSGRVAHGPQVVAGAKALLASHGLKPGQYKEYEEVGEEPERFLDELRLEANAFEPNGNQADWGQNLPPIQRVAAEMFYGADEPIFLSSALEIFQSLKGEDPSSRSGVDRKRVVADLIGQFGDLPIDKYDRNQANAFVKHLLDRGNRTTTVQRRMNSIRPVFSVVSKEKGFVDKGIFEGLIIPKMGEDKVDRLPYSLAEIRLIQRACLEADDDIRWVIALLSDTGLRLGEATGLMVRDVDLKGPVPHVKVRKNAVRRLKTKDSQRDVPLVGASLWAIGRALEHTNSDFVFPRYIDTAKTPPEHKGTHASNTMTKWLRALPIEAQDQKGTHSFRHSIQDRLRECQVPQEIRNVLCGWTNKGIGEGYGAGYSLGLLREHLEKVVLADLSW